jgi:hypothetical protein
MADVSEGELTVWKEPDTRVLLAMRRKVMAWVTPPLILILIPLHSYWHKATIDNALVLLQACK